jgi:hypothetical protein
VELGYYTFRSFCRSPVVSAQYSHTGMKQRQLFWRKFFEDLLCLTPGPAAPYLEFFFYPELLIISYVKSIENYLAFMPRNRTKCHLYSQSKLTRLRRKNRNIRYKNVSLKANEHDTHVWKLQIYRTTQKKHATKSRETIPLTKT